MDNAATTRVSDAMVLVDSASAARHMPVDAQDMDCDFFVLLGHNMLVPAGMGMHYSKGAVLDHFASESYGGRCGGECQHLECDLRRYPYRLELGMPNISDIMALPPPWIISRLWGRTKACTWEEKFIEHLADGLEHMLEVKSPGRP